MLIHTLKIKHILNFYIFNYELFRKLEDNIKSKKFLHFKQALECHV